MLQPVAARERRHGTEVLRCSRTFWCRPTAPDGENGMARLLIGSETTRVLTQVKIPILVHR